MFKKVVSVLVMIFFIISSVVPLGAQAQTMPSFLNLPEPGAMLTATAAYNPPVIMGVNLRPEDSLMFDFIIDKGDSGLEGEEFNTEANKLIKYFLAALTTPQEHMWVNLSPYESGRIIPEVFGRTEMGRDMLAQDYILKQLSASLLSPEEALGEAFWNRFQTQARAKFGSSDVPLSVFNKIWIVPEVASIFEHAKGAYIVESKLKVMLEQDYLALDVNRNSTEHGLGAMTDIDLNQITGTAAEIIREVLLPEIEREVNEGRLFAPLRQIFHSMLLAKWYKDNLKESLLGQVYADQSKTAGVDTDPSANQHIYDAYLKAFETGAYNYMKEEYDPATQSVIPKKYFSGGVDGKRTDYAMTTKNPDDELNKKLVIATAGVSATHLSKPTASLDITGMTVYSDINPNFYYPNAVETLSDGSIVMGDSMAIGPGATIIRPDGSILSLKGVDGRPLSSETVKQVAATSEGDLYVATSGRDDDRESSDFIQYRSARIYHFDRDGNILSSFDVKPSNGDYSKRLVNIQGLGVYGSKIIYSIMDVGELRIRDKETGEEKVVDWITDIEEWGTSIGAMFLKIDSVNGFVYVFNPGGDLESLGERFRDSPVNFLQIRRYDLNSDVWETVKTKKKFKKVGDIAIDPDGYSYLADNDRNLIVIIDPEGMGVGALPYGRSQITALDVDLNGNLLVGRQGGVDMFSKEAISQYIRPESTMPRVQNISQGQESEQSFPKKLIKEIFSDLGQNQELKEIGFPEGLLDLRDFESEETELNPQEMFRIFFLQWKKSVEIDEINYFQLFKVYSVLFGGSKGALTASQVVLEISKEVSFHEALRALGQLIPETPYENGTVAKLQISEVGSNGVGATILDELIKKGVVDVDDVSATEVRLMPNLDQKISIVREIAKENFEEVWDILQMSQLDGLPYELTDLSNFDKLYWIIVKSHQERAVENVLVEKGVIKDPSVILEAAFRIWTQAANDFMQANDGEKRIIADYYLGILYQIPDLSGFTDRMDDFAKESHYGIPDYYNKEDLSDFEEEKRLAMKIEFQNLIEEMEEYQTSYGYSIQINDFQSQSGHSIEPIRFFPFYVSQLYGYPDMEITAGIYGRADLKKTLALVRNNPNFFKDLIYISSEEVGEIINNLIHNWRKNPNTGEMYNDREWSKYAALPKSRYWKEILDYFLQRRINISGYGTFTEAKIFDQMSDQFRQHSSLGSQGSESNAAMMANREVGGIDFNPAIVEMKVFNDGEGFEVIPPTLEEIRQFMDTNGFVPVIINVQPVVNLPMLLGMAQDDAPQSPSARGTISRL